MIPSSDTDLLELEVETISSRNYRMNIDDNTINGMVDDVEAMKQVNYKILNTERYQYAIYSWDYGIELNDLYGQPIEYVVPELERRIVEALTQDERNESVDNFEFDTSNKKCVVCTFDVHTIFGNYTEQKEVEI